MGAFAPLPSVLRLPSPFRCVREVSRRPRPLSASRNVVCSTATTALAKRVVFLGTPAVAATSLQRIWDAAKLSQSSATDGSDQFHVVAVVSQPPALTGRKRALTPSPVHLLAESLGIESVLTPESARDTEFLDQLTRLKPDLCITAAYGNFLPQRVLDIPRLGTLNIHPSLLPHFRGAAPVPRALEAGVSETGVSVAFTSLKMDSGPVLVQKRVTLDGSEQAPELLQALFDLGSDALISSLPLVFSGDALSVATPQDDAAATEASKLSKGEARLTFVESAVIVHNKIRAFAGWPGTWADFAVTDITTGKSEAVRLKVIKSRILRSEGGMCLGVHDVSLTKDGELGIICDDGSVLGLSIVQPPGKRAMTATAFWNGLRGKALGRKRVPH
jgi:methionyl-tRNA formyltransferase